ASQGCACDPERRCMQSGWKTVAVAGAVAVLTLVIAASGDAWPACTDACTGICGQSVTCDTGTGGAQTIQCSACPSTPTATRSATPTATPTPLYPACSDACVGHCGQTVSCETGGSGGIQSFQCGACSATPT